MLEPVPMSHKRGYVNPFADCQKTPQQSSSISTILVPSTHYIGMLDCRTGAFESVPGGCFDRRKKLHNYERLVKDTTALPDAAVENVLLQRALAAVARAGMFRAVRRCRLCTNACTPGYHVRQCALGVLHAAGKPRGTEPYSDSGDQEIQRSEQIGAALARRGDTVTQLVCRDACDERGIHDKVPRTETP